MRSYDKIILDSFEDLLLVESFDFTEVEYGSNDDMDDKKWIKDNDKSYWKTFFKLENGFNIMVMMTPFGKDGYVLKFKTAKEHTTDYNKYSFAVHGFDLALPIFNKVMYVTSEGIKHLNPSPGSIIFEATAENPRLAPFYAKMIENKSFQNRMKEINFYLADTEEGTYTFKRIK